MQGSFGRHGDLRMTGEGLRAFPEGGEGSRHCRKGQMQGSFGRHGDLRMTGEGLRAFPEGGEGSRHCRKEQMRGSFGRQGGLRMTEEGAAQSGEPVAVVAGQPIYEKDLLPGIQGQLQQLHNQEYQIENSALERLIEKKLLEAEAKKRGITVDELWKQEVDSKVTEPTAGEVEAFYLGRREFGNRPLAEVEAQVRAELKAAKSQKLRENFLKRLRDEAQVAVYLSPPRVEVSYDPARLRGSADAPVTIVEFSDYQCPYCRKAEATLDEVLAKYPGEVSLAYRDFPLRQIHPQAEMAAEAARCAGEQGKFWEYHDRLLTDPPKLDKASLLEDARGLGLDADKFGACLESGKFKAQVDADSQAGSRLGVSGTPTFFINGIFMTGAQPAEAYEKVIDAELARKEHGGMKKASAGREEPRTK
jgi:protein-disulfide isomerase